MSKNGSSAFNALKSALTLGLAATTALAATGCIIIVPAPKKGDAFQPPPAKPIAFKQGDTHKLRMSCGQKAVFQSQTTTPEHFTVGLNAVNLQPVSQLETASMRVRFQGSGANVDVPFNVGDQSQRNAKGSVSVSVAPGSNELVIAMENKPACGPVNLTLTIK